MSSQKGNISRTRTQKHKNITKFENDKFDKSKKNQLINNTPLLSLCEKCVGIIAWKIKYKKYKPLTVPGKCVKCEERTVKLAYHTICTPCSEELDKCAKCLEVAPCKQEENDT